MAVLLDEEHVALGRNEPDTALVFTTDSVTFRDSGGRHYIMSFMSAVRSTSDLLKVNKRTSFPS